MKLIINLSGNLVGGGLQVALSFLSESRSFCNNEYHVLLGQSAADQIFKTEFSDNYFFYNIPKLNFYQYSSYLKKVEAGIIPDVVFTVFGPSYWRPKAPHVMGYAIPYYIYPNSPFWHMISIQEKIIISLKKMIHLRYFKKDADVLLCETDDAKDRLKTLLKNKQISTVSNTCGAHFLNTDNSHFINILPCRRAKEFRYLTLSKLYSHKNIDKIRLIVDSLIEKGIVNIVFVLTITKEEYSKLFGDGYRAYISTVGPISANECPSLYLECDAMFLPTTMECFSASYPEAMAMKKPIITSDLGFARDICRDAALFVNPMDIADMVEKIISLSVDENIQQELIAKGEDRLKSFPTASQRAVMYLDICNKAIIN